MGMCTFLVHFGKGMLGIIFVAILSILGVVIINFLGPKCLLSLRRPISSSHLFAKKCFLKGPNPWSEAITTVVSFPAFSKISPLALSICLYPSQIALLYFDEWTWLPSPSINSQNRC